MIHFLATLFFAFLGFILLGILFYLGSVLILTAFLWPFMMVKAFWEILCEMFTRRP